MHGAVPYFGIEKRRTDSILFLSIRETTIINCSGRYIDYFLLYLREGFRD
jgi:hypothetical protein